MKELSIEEKAKAYDEAFERAKQWRNAPNVDKIPTFANRVIEDIFPELKESEDERTRESLLEYLHTLPNHYTHSGVCVLEWIAWIEKQAQKPVWSEEDKNMLKWVIGYLENKMLNAPISEERTACKNAIAWLKEEVQPQTKQEWSEADERMCKAIIDNIKAICKEGYFVGNIGSDKLINWFKDLRHRLQWKPSDEQMFALNIAIKMEDGDILKSLYEQLKKLREEQS